MDFEVAEVIDECVSFAGSNYPDYNIIVQALTVKNDQKVIVLE